MDSLSGAGQALATYLIDYDEEVGQAAVRHVYDLARHGYGRPFLLVASFIHPHDPYVARPEWWDLYEHDAIDLPAAPPDAPEPHVRRIRRGIQADSVGYSEAQCRNARHGYYANTSFFDSWLGRLLAVLAVVGELDRTVVIATSDHDDMLGDWGTWFKMCFCERSARVPLVVAGPGVADRRDVRSAPNEPNARARWTAAAGRAPHRGAGSSWRLAIQWPERCDRRRERPALWLRSPRLAVGYSPPMGEDVGLNVLDTTGAGAPAAEPRRKIKAKDYERELVRLQEELVRLQRWIRHKGLKVVVIFEGRDAAGKGGAIKRITERLNPRVVRVVALGTPSDREKTQWWFQRYVEELPAAGEMVLFDRSWYNRGLVEPVMGFCTDEEYREFLRSCPEFERMLVRSGIVLIKYWFSVSDAEQERRFQNRINDPKRRWKLSQMDLEGRARWVEFSRAKDTLFAHTDIKQAPWFVVDADSKKAARLNCISHLLSLIPYEDVPWEEVELPDRQERVGYVRPPMSDQTFVPEIY